MPGETKKESKKVRKRVMMITNSTIVTSYEARLRFLVLLQKKREAESKTRFELLWDAQHFVRGWLFVLCGLLCGLNALSNSNRVFWLCLALIEDTPSSTGKIMHCSDRGNT